MKTLEEQVLSCIPEIAQLVGTEMRRSTGKGGDYVEVPGHGCVLRVRWEIERESALQVTLYREAQEDHLLPRELALWWFVKFKGGPDEDDRALSPYKVEDDIKLVKKYALGYLLGLETDFDAVVALVDGEAEEKSNYSQWNKANKWIRPEWPPSN